MGVPDIAERLEPRFRRGDSPDEGFVTGDAAGLAAGDIVGVDVNPAAPESIVISASRNSRPHPVQARASSGFGHRQ